MKYRIKNIIINNVMLVNKKKTNSKLYDKMKTTSIKLFKDISDINFTHRKKKEVI